MRATWKIKERYTRPFFQEETGFKMAWVFPSSSNRPLLFKRMPVLAEYHVIDFRQIHWLRGKISLTCCREQKAAFLSVGSQSRPRALLRM